MPELAVLALQSFDPVTFGGRHTITSTAVRLSTPNPRPKRIRPTTNLRRNRFDRSRLAIKFILMLEHHPHSPLAHFR